MIRIKPTRRFRVSNRLALVGALTLSLTLFTGIDGMQDETTANIADTNVTLQAAQDNNEAEPAERRKRFSVSRLLFGHG